MLEAARSSNGNLSEMLLTAALRRGEHSALIDGPEHASYTALAARLALGFAGGPGRGGRRTGWDRVAILLRRGADAAAAFFGALAAGAVAVIVNESLRPRQIEHILGHSAAVGAADRRRASPSACRGRSTTSATIARRRRACPAPATAAPPCPSSAATWRRSSTRRARPGCRRA